LSKVTTIDFDSEIEVYKLEKNRFDINDFKCKNSVYENYIKKDAFEDQEKSIAQTWIFVYKNQNVIGYVSIAMGHVNKTQHVKLRSLPHTNIPGLLLGRIATHQDFERLGVGHKMIDWVFFKAIDYALGIGCRILFLNPESGVEKWYTDMKFVQIKTKRHNMMFYDLDIYKQKNSNPS
jgi:hypothetical protein